MDRRILTHRKPNDTREWEDVIMDNAVEYVASVGREHATRAIMQAKITELHEMCTRECAQAYGDETDSSRFPKCRMACASDLKALCAQLSE